MSDSTANSSTPPPAIVEIRELIQAVGWTMPDHEHALRCGRFAAVIFDGLHGLLELAQTERSLTIAAATFHDVGYLRGGRDHHRKSFDLIRDAVDLPFSDGDRIVVAAAARYHGHTVPNIEHAGFGEMTFADQRRVRRIAAIVRLASALDASHLRLIEDVEVDIDADGVRLTAIAANEPPIERDRLREAAGGFEHLTQIPIQVDIVVRPGWPN